MKLEAIRALVVGMEKSDQASAAFLLARGADVTSTDVKPMALPGFRPQSDDLFGEWLDAVRARGVDVIGEIELAAQLLCGKIFGIAGSNGQ